jgi:uncharacterized protein (TIGR03382 family)
MKSLKFLFLLGLCCAVVGPAKADLLPPDDLPTEPPTDKPTEQCKTDTDCGSDYVCSFYTTDCAVAEPAPAIDPATGTGGGSAGSGSSGGPEGTPADCTPTTYSYCEYKPKPCTADSECTDGNVCIKYTYQTCSGGDDVPVSGGPTPQPGTDPAPGVPRKSNREPVEPTCTDVTEAYCGPKWTAPCKADADCGEGFNCVEAQECSAGGSTGSGGSGGSPDVGAPTPLADAAEPTGDTADCKGTGTFYCQLKPMPCAADSDCPADFTCVSFSSPSDGTCSIDSDGNKSCDEPTEPATTSECHPKNDYYPVPGGTGGPSFGGGVAEDGTPRDDANGGDGNEQPVSAPGTTDKGDDNGAVTNDPASQSGANGSTTGASGDANADADAEGSKTLGCAAQHDPDATSGLSLLALLGLVVTFRRRRA